MIVSGRLLKLNAICLLLMGILILGGCSNKKKQAELQEYVRKIQSRTGKEIEPLPELKPYESFTYSAMNLRSPFVQSIPEESSKKEAVTGGIHPDANRHKEALETFPLDSLRMVGTIEKEGKKWSLIVDPSSAVTRVTVGNYIGQNHGRIDKVLDDKLELTEIVPDPNGGWRERKASISIAEQGLPGKERKK